MEVSSSYFQVTSQACHCLQKDTWFLEIRFAVSDVLAVSGMIAASLKWTHPWPPSYRCEAKSFADAPLHSASSVQWRTRMRYYEAGN